MSVSSQFEEYVIEARMISFEATSRRCSPLPIRSARTGALGIAVPDRDGTAGELDRDGGM